MAELSGAVSTHELLATFDCRTWSCPGEARNRGGLCSYCASVAGAKRAPEDATLHWRRLVRKLDPLPGTSCSGLVFQAVAAALADYADHEDGRYHPSVASLAADCRISERSVQSALAALERWRLIRRDRRGGRGKTTRYKLLTAEEVAHAPLGPGSETRAARAVSHS